MHLLCRMQPAADPAYDPIMAVRFLSGLSDRALANDVMVHSPTPNPQAAEAAVCARLVFFPVPSASGSVAVAAAAPASFAAAAAGSAGTSRAAPSADSVRQRDALPDSVCEDRFQRGLCLWCGDQDHQRRHCPLRRANPKGRPVLPSGFSSAAGK